MVALLRDGRYWASIAIYMYVGADHMVYVTSGMVKPNPVQEMPFSSYRHRHLQTSTDCCCTCFEGKK